MKANKIPVSKLLTKHVSNIRMPVSSRNYYTMLGYSVLAKHLVKMLDQKHYPPGNNYPLRGLSYFFW